MTAFHDLKMPLADGGQADFGEFRDEACLIVNLASQ